MEIISKHIGQSVDTIVVKGADSHESAVAEAMRVTGETPARLQDWDTDEFDKGIVTVRLYKW